MRAATSSVKCSCKSAAFAATDADATAPIAHSTRAAPSVPGPIGAAAAQRRLDADATISVDVGAHSGGDWACA